MTVYPHCQYVHKTHITGKPHSFGHMGICRSTITAGGNWKKDKQGKQRRRRWRRRRRKEKEEEEKQTNKQTKKQKQNKKEKRRRKRRRREIENKTEKIKHVNIPWASEWYAYCPLFHFFTNFACTHAPLKYIFILTNCLFTLLYKDCV